MQRGMRGFIFTVDAVFALIIAAAAVSIILYAHFAAPSAYQPPVTEAQTVLASLLGQTVGGLAGEFPAYVANATASQAATWPQFSGSASLNASSSFGPTAPRVAFAFTGNGVLTPAVASGGLVAVASSAGSNSSLYVLNASTGAPIFEARTGAPVTAPPVFYDNEVVYANAGGTVTALGTQPGPSLGSELWSVQLSAGGSPSLTGSSACSTTQASNDGPVSISISPNAVAIPAGGSVTFTNSTTGNAEKPYTYCYSVNPITGVSRSGNRLVFNSSGTYNVTLSFIDSNRDTNASNSSTVTVTGGAGPGISAFLGLGDGYVSATYGNTIYLLDPRSGAVAAKGSATGFLPLSAPMYYDGEFVASNPRPSPSENVTAFTRAGNTLVSVWSRPIGSEGSSAPVAAFGHIAVANGTSLTMLSTSGNLSASFSLAAVPMGDIAAGQYAAYVQTADSLYAINFTGTSLSAAWQARTQSNLYNATPAVASSAGTVYALVNATTLAAYSASSGGVEWVLSLMPSQAHEALSGIALAYGDAYVTSGNTLYAVGQYRAQPTVSALGAIAQMYLSGSGGMANILLSRINPTYSYGLLANGAYMPSMSIADLNGDGFVSASGIGSADISTGNLTMAAWFMPASFASLSGDQGILLSKAGSYRLGVNVSGGMARPWASIQLGTKVSITGNAVLPVDSWFFEAATFNGSVFTLYLNGTPVANATITGRLAMSANALVIGCSASANACPGTSNALNGSLAGVQLYGTALTHRQIAGLYQNGAFSMPDAGVSAWWPLDGDTNDYSYNGEYGIGSGVAFTTQDYTPLSLANAYQISKASTPLYLQHGGAASRYNVSVVVWR